MMHIQKWNSSFEACDLCGCKIKGSVEYFVDGITMHNVWALMCPECFKKYGTKIQYGFGQKYDGNTGLLLEGGYDPSIDNSEFIEICPTCSRAFDSTKEGTTILNVLFCSKECGYKRFPNFKKD